MTDMPLSLLMQSDSISELSARDTIAKIKAAAIRQLETLDGRMSIHSTEYFNHSFTPDLVLRWPKGSGSERYVYMRSSSRDDVLFDDVARLGELHPILLELVPLQRHVHQEGTDSIDRLAHDNDTLVTDPAALARIGEAKRLRPVTGLFSAALAQGGRGLLDDNGAGEASDAIEQGFNGARQIDAESVSRAAATANDRLSTRFSERFNRLLQATWIASGGRAELFPNNQLSLTVGVDDDALEYLLDLEPIMDPDFWRGIGRNASISQIGKLFPRHPNANLQLLIKANLDRFNVRSCRVQDRQQQLDEQDGPDFYWRTERNALALRSPDWIAFVAEKADELNDVEGTRTEGVPVPDLLGRARDTVLTGIEVSDGSFELDLRSSGLNVIDSDHLSAVTESFGKLARVLRARALAGGRQIACDFSKSSASTHSTIPLGELLGVSLPLLRRLDDATRSELEDLLEPIRAEAALLTPEPADAVADQLVLGLSDDDLSRLRKQIGERETPEIEGPIDSDEASDS